MANGFEAQCDISKMFEYWVSNNKKVQQSATGFYWDSMNIVIKYSHQTYVYTI